MGKGLRSLLENKELAMKVCLLLMLLWGIVVSLMIPPWQTPDEYTHLQMIGAGINNGKIADIFMQDMELDQGRIRFSYEEKVDIETWKRSMTRMPGYSRGECMPNGIHPIILKHLPAVIGILLGILFHLPTFWVLELGELFSLLFYLGICALALHLQPMKKEVMLLVMALPMTMQQAASLSYDAVLISLCFLFTSYVFYMRDTKAKLGWGELVHTLLLLALIAYIKIPYLLLGLLIFLLPKEKIHLKLFKMEINGEWIQKWKIPVGILTAFLLVAGFCMFRDNFWVKLVCGLFLEWRRTLWLFRSTIDVWGSSLLVSAIGQFGWLETSVPIAFVYMSYALLILFAIWDEKTAAVNNIRKRTRCYIFGVFFLLCGFIFLSMVNHTIMTVLFGSEGAEASYDIRDAVYKIPYIGGLQGRYFLPFLILPFIALPETGWTVKGKAWMVVLYISLGIAITVFVLWKRYWKV